MLVETPWRSGSFRGAKPKLIFGCMYEDPAVELRAFPPEIRVFAIASAGCTARALAAAGHRVTAVDINPLQLQYAQARSAGAPAIPGAADRLLSLGRRFLGLLGWTAARRRAFLGLGDPVEQSVYWRCTMDSARSRAAIDLLASPALLRLFYAGPFTAALPRDFGRRLSDRMYCCSATYPNRDNPYLRTLLLGAPPPEYGAARHEIRFSCADAAAFLESCPPGGFDAFTLSNILDGASADYAARMWNAVRHAGAPGARVVLRSFAESAGQTALADRCPLWGSVSCRTL